jgi:membrane protein DedA with SNARE-associated domain
MFRAPHQAIECNPIDPATFARSVADLDFLMEHGSYGLIVFVLILTGAGLPMPEEVPIVYAGVAASVGTLNAWGALAACFAGALIGDCVLYTIGYHFGHGLAMKHPRLADFLHAEREARVEKWITQHGLKVLFVARFLVFLRAPVYLAVGVLRMPVRRFLLIDTFCAAAVVGVVFGLSYLYGGRIKGVIQGSELLLTVIVVLCVVAALLWTWWKGRSLRTDSSLPTDSSLQTDPTEPPKAEKMTR